MRCAAAALGMGLLACGSSPSGPRVIAKAGAGATLLDAFDGRVYWLVGSALLWKDDSLAAPMQAPVDAVDWAGRDNFFVDATGLYYTHHNQLAHVEVPAGKGVRVELDGRPAGQHPAGVARQGDCIFVLDVDVECRGHGQIIGWPLVEGAMCPAYGVAAGGLQPRPFAADAQRFYWANEPCPSRSSVTSTGISTADRTTGVVTALAPDEPNVADLQVGTRGVYWRTPGGIRRAAAGEAAATIIPGAISSVAVIAGNIYYAGDDGIYWMPEAGGAAHLIAGVTGVKQLAADARYLYWMTSSGDIVRAPRPG